MKEYVWVKLIDDDSDFLALCQEIPLSRWMNYNLNIFYVPVYKDIITQKYIYPKYNFIPNKKENGKLIGKYNNFPSDIEAKDFLHSMTQEKVIEYRQHIQEIEDKISNKQKTSYKIKKLKKHI